MSQSTALPSDFRVCSSKDDYFFFVFSFNLIMEQFQCVIRSLLSLLYYLGKLSFRIWTKVILLRVTSRKRKEVRVGTAASLNRRGGLRLKITNRPWCLWLYLMMKEQWAFHINSGRILLKSLSKIEEAIGVLYSRFGRLPKCNYNPLKEIYHPFWQPTMKNHLDLWCSPLSLSQSTSPLKE